MSLPSKTLVVCFILYWERFAVGWNGIDYWNGKYSGSGISYTSTDNNNGFWSSDYGYLTYVNYNDRCSQCSCTWDNSVFLIDSSVPCSGPSVHLEQVPNFINITNNTFASTVTSITIRDCRSFTTIHPGSFDSLSELTYLEIRSCPLATIDKDMFLQNTKLQYLYIRQTSLPWIPDLSRTSLEIINLASNAIVMDTLNYDGWSLPNETQYLALMHNKMHWVPPGWVSGSNIRLVSFAYNHLFQLPVNTFGELPSLVYLGVEGNQLKRLSKATFEHFPSTFVHLNASNNVISHVEPGTFSQLDQLKIIELHSNSFATIKYDTFSNIAELLHLDLNNNYLNVIPSRSFQNLPNLREFRLHSQRDPLVKIVYDAWENIGPELKYLFVSSNALTTFPHQILSEGVYPKLEIIHADHNEISNITEYGFEAFTIQRRPLYERMKERFVPFETVSHISTLYLNDNLLIGFNSTDYCELTNLQNLYIHDNYISEAAIGTTGLNCLSNLQYLYMSNNQIVNVTMNTTAENCLDSLIYLDLDNNWLQHVPESLRRKHCIPNIQTLRLNRNKLGFLEARTFSSLSTLLNTYFENNGIIAIENDTFPDSINTIDLSNNNFHFLHLHPFSNLSNLATLHLDNNNIDFLPIDAYENCTSLTNLHLQTNQIPQIYKRHFENCPLTGNLYLHDNDIGWIEDGTFSHISAMGNLYLSNNKISLIPMSGSFNDISFSGSFLLSSNRITSVQSEAFVNLRVPSHYSFSLSNNKIASVATDGFKSLSAYSFDLRSNPLRTMNPYSFDSCSFTYAYLSGLEFTELPSYALNDFGFYSLSMSGGALQTIKSRAFNNVRGGSTSTLNLGSNDISTIESGAFTSVATGSFYLTNNPITDIQSYAFNSTSCKDLYMGGLPLTQLPSFAFNGVSVSEDFFLNSGSLEIIHPQAFYDVRVSEKFYLHDNNIQQINSPIFGPTSSIGEEIHLQGNNISRIADGAFADVDLTDVILNDNRLTAYPRALGEATPRYVDIQRNQITDLIHGDFSSSSTVERLDLRDNGISELHSGVLDQMVSLTELYLNGNDISFIEGGTFDGLGSLEVLHLEQNLIRHVPTFPSSLSSLERIYLEHNKIETVGPLAFSSPPNMVSVSLADNVFACQCQTTKALHKQSFAITDVVCMSPANVVGTMLGANATDPNLENKWTLFRCSGTEINGQVISEEEIVIEWKRSNELYAYQLPGATEEPITVNCTDYSTNCTNCTESNNCTVSGDCQSINTTNCTANTNDTVVVGCESTGDLFTSALANQTVFYHVTCVSSTSSSINKVVEACGAELDFSLTLNQTDGVKPRTNYECSIKLQADGQTSAKSEPVLLTTPDISGAANTNPSNSSSNTTFTVVYYDFTGGHSDFTGISYTSIPTPTYVASPYKPWLSISNTPSTDTFSEWYRHVPGSNIEVETQIDFDVTGTSKKFWSDAYFPLDNNGFGIEDQPSCTNQSHNFGFTSAIRTGLRYQGTEKITIGGGDALWLYINKVLIAENVAAGLTDAYKCYKVDLTTTDDTGNTAAFVEQGTIVSGSCIVPSSAVQTNVTLNLEVGEIYHFDIFHAETQPCTSEFLLELENCQFSSNSSEDFPLDYTMTVSEGLHVDGVVGTVYLTDVFSVGPGYDVTLVSGNEFRHFELKDDTTQNWALHDAQPSTVAPTYTFVPDTNLLYIECPVSTDPTPAPEDISPEYFSVNGTTALLAVAGSLDRETISSYRLVMWVFDEGYDIIGRTGSIVIKIVVEDINDNCPVFPEQSYSIVPAPVLKEGPIYTFGITDADIDINADISYYVSVIQESPLVDYNSDTYFLWKAPNENLTSSVIYSNATTLTFELYAIDKGTPPRGSSVSVSVTLNNTCLVDTQFTNIPYHFTVQNNVADLYLRIPKYTIHHYECMDFVGVSSGWIRDQYLTASSVFNDSTKAERGRLNITAGTYLPLAAGWVAGVNNVDQFFQVEFESPHKLTAVHMQGRGDADQWVTLYRLLYLDNKTDTWEVYINASGTSNFTANFDRSTIQTEYLDPPVFSTFIRINPLQWNDSIALRLELSGCPQFYQFLYDTWCFRCDAGYYCKGDGVMRACGRCDPPQVNGTCGRDPSEHSFGAASECTSCPDGWICKDGLAYKCPQYKYVLYCNETYCPDSCSACEEGYACRGGGRYMCDVGTYSDGKMEFCALCRPGTYQDETGQNNCKICPSGLFSTTKSRNCSRCTGDTYANADGTSCVDCLDESECPCRSGAALCLFGAECYNLGGGNYECGDCLPGFADLGSGCEDIDECALYQPCWNASACVNTVPGYQCLACPLGYSGTYEDAQAWDLHRRVFLFMNLEFAALQEQICYDIDECESNHSVCKENVQCMNTIGSYSCNFCEEGYIGNETTGCVLADACISGDNNCHSDADCIFDGPGKFLCRCKEGFAGNGVACYKDTDQDGHPDISVSCEDWGCKRDNCMTTPNSDQVDTDNDQLGDTCDRDDDNDAYYDIRDNCQFVQNADQLDSDGDFVGDVCDNCPSVSNTDQLDTDADGTGDLCSNDNDGDGILDSADNCPLISNPGQENAWDSDSVGDACDNCLFVDNNNQEDTDQNRFGDACDVVGASNKDSTVFTNVDAPYEMSDTLILESMKTYGRVKKYYTGTKSGNEDRKQCQLFIDGRKMDGDSVLDFLDNCPEAANGNQADTDGDGFGDKCDTDIDGDGVNNGNDNCPYLPNSAQVDVNGDKIGDICALDYDGDGVENRNDTCENNSAISVTSFLPYFTVDLYPTLSTTSPVWQVRPSGNEIRQFEDTAMPTMLIGNQTYGPMVFSGSWYVVNSVAEDYIGFVFGYKNNRKFYIALWKRVHHNYEDTNKGGIKGIQIKLVDSTTGPGSSLTEALWHSYDTSSQVTLIWQDPEMNSWETETSYRWKVEHQPSLGYIRLTIYRGEQLLTDSGPLYDGEITGGRVGVFQHGQFGVIWSNLKVECLPHGNRALKFDGIDDYVKLGDTVEMGISKSFTFEAWFMLEAGFTGGRLPIFCSTHGNICLWIESGITHGQCVDTQITGSTNYNADQWYNIVFRYSFEELSLSLFVNGVEDGVAVVMNEIQWAQSNATTMYLGKNGTQDDLFIGTIDEVRIYNISIPDSEIAEHIQLKSLANPKLHGYVNVELQMEETFTRPVSLTNTGNVSIPLELFGNPSTVQSNQDYQQFRLIDPDS